MAHAMSTRVMRAMGACHRARTRYAPVRAGGRRQLDGPRQRVVWGGGRTAGIPGRDPTRVGLVLASGNAASPLRPLAGAGGRHFHATSGAWRRASGRGRCGVVGARVDTCVRRRGPGAAPCIACETHSSRAIATSLLRREAATRSAAGLLRIARTTPTRDRGGARHRRGTAQRTARMLTATLSSSASAAAARPAPHARRPTTSTPTARVGVCVRAPAAVRLSGARSAFVRSSGGGGAATLTACAGRRTTVAPSRRTMRVRRPRQPLRRRNPGGLGSTRQRLVPPPPVRVVLTNRLLFRQRGIPHHAKLQSLCCYIPNRLSLPRRRWSGGWRATGAH